jgi:hypothetical protein
MNTLTTSSVAGGSAGGILSTSINIVSMPLSVFGLPDLSMMLNTVILAFIGATVGYFTKLIWDKIFIKRKRKNDIN